MPLHAGQAAQVAQAAQAVKVPPGVMQVINKYMPDGVDEIAPSPLPGFFHVRARGQVFYISKDGKHLLVGDVINTQSRINYTEDLHRKSRLDAMQEAANNLVSYVPKKELYRITVLTDVNCGYCRKFHQHMPELMRLGVHVDYLLTPFLGPEAYQKAVGVWCAADRNKMMDIGKAGKDVPEKKCAHPVEKNLRTAQLLGSRGTPFIVLETGDAITGYMPPDKLVQRIRQLGIQPRS